MELIAYRPQAGVWRGLDTVQALTTGDAVGLVAAGIRWVARYLRRDGEVMDHPRPGGEYGWAVADGCHSISHRELREVTGAGLAVLPVQFGTFGSTIIGQERGGAAVAAARKLGLPQGMHLWVDVEGSAPKKSAPRTIAYIEAWAAAVTAGGYLAGLYCTDLELSSRQLYGLRGITSYWSAGGPPPRNPLPRGFAVEQDPPIRDYPDDEQRLGDSRIAGVACDTDTLRQDRFGACPALVATPELAMLWHCTAAHAIVDDYGQYLPQ